MVKVTAAEFAEKWGRKLKGATEDIRRGIEKVTEAPGEKAAAKVDKMKARLNEKIDDGTWARRVAGVSLSEWKEKALNKGIGRIAAGVDGAGNKMQEFAAEFLPHVERGQEIINAMPDTTLEDAKARAVAMIDHNAKFKRS